MKDIFIRVTRSATVLDQTFSEQFGPVANGIAASVGNERQSALDIETQSDRYAAARPRSTVGTTAAFHSQETAGRSDNTSNGRQQTSQPPSSRSSSPMQAQVRPHRDASMTAEVPRCEHHALPCLEREVTRDGPNTGRTFYICPLPQSEQCNFFAWACASSASGIPAVHCPSHDEPCAERTVKKDGPNKGRQFYTCRRSQTDSCGFFKWKDESSEALNASAPQSASRTSGTSDAIPKCSAHNIACVLRKTRKAGPNQDREFYSCSFQGADSCGYFEWKDESKSHRQQPPSSSSSLPRSTGSSNDTEVPMCMCCLPGISLTCKNGANKGRTFYKCPNPQGSQCDFFQWAS